MLIFIALTLSIIALLVIRRRRQIHYVLSQSALLMRSMRNEFHRLENEPHMMAPEHAKEISVES